MTTRVQTVQDNQLNQTAEKIEESVDQTLAFLQSAFEQQTAQLSRLNDSIGQLHDTVVKLAQNQDSHFISLTNLQNTISQLLQQTLPSLTDATDLLASTVERRPLRNRLIVHNPEGEPLAVIGV